MLAGYLCLILEAILKSGPIPGRAQGSSARAHDRHQQGDIFFNRPDRRARPGVLLRKKPIKTLFSGGRGLLKYFFKNQLTRRAGIGYFYAHQRDARLPPAPKNDFSAGLDSEGIDGYIHIRLTPKGKKVRRKNERGTVPAPHVKGCGWQSLCLRLDL